MLCSQACKPVRDVDAPDEGSEGDAMTTFAEAWMAYESTRGVVGHGFGMAAIAREYESESPTDPPSPTTETLFSDQEELWDDDVVIDPRRGRLLRMPPSESPSPPTLRRLREVARAR